jgi:ATP-binding cassette, subfamily G (WHITE), member 2, PDR
MESYADAIVGVPGEGLNVEQRKRLTIGVEMAAKPALLLFLDEPTSGLDSQTAWSICSLLRKLANNGQAILCTIHQPSAILFQEFERLLFLAKGGHTVYFGEIGKSSEILTSYFKRNGSRPCGAEENPAEWMLDVIGAAPGSETTIDWVNTWNRSPERQEVKRQLVIMKAELSQKPVQNDDPDALKEYAAPFVTQLPVVLTRVFEQYWRTPSYLYSKFLLVTACYLFIGFSLYNTPVSLQGTQNQLLSIFMVFTGTDSLTDPCSYLLLLTISQCSAIWFNKLCPISSPNAPFTKLASDPPKLIHGKFLSQATSSSNYPGISSARLSSLFHSTTPLACTRTRSPTTKSLSVAGSSSSSFGYS